MNMNRENIKKLKTITILLIIVFTLSILVMNTQKQYIETNSNIENNKKIGWGIKRNNTHEQPDVGKENKKILEENGGICLGNADKKNIYLTFDEGYEAGYTSQILDILKQNDVKATFFITAHYVNTQEELVKRIIDEGHIVGNHIPNFLMSQI